MTDPRKAPQAPGYVPNPHYTQEDWDEVSDNPELTDEQLAEMKPFAEAFPELAASIAKRGPQKAPTKVATSIRLDPDVIEGFKATGGGWQSRINEALRKALRTRAPKPSTGSRGTTKIKALAKAKRKANSL
jgi:uncharacterized protein (DUF4415 family)